VLYQSHLITIKNFKNQWAQVSKLKLLCFSISSCWYHSTHVLQCIPCYICNNGTALLVRVTVKTSRLYRTPCTK
jgi:hypothetical protein